MLMSRIFFRKNMIQQIQNLINLNENLMNQLHMMEEQLYMLLVGQKAIINNFNNFFVSQRKLCFRVKMPLSQKKAYTLQNRKNIQIHEKKPNLQLITNLIFMLKLTFLFLFLALITLSNSQANVWNNWNNYATSYPGTTRSFVPPAIPADYSRYVDSSNSTYSVRKNQYRYIYTDPVLGGSINVYCGLRSFLTQINGYIFCIRDTRSMFYGAYPSLSQFCIPDVDANAISGMYIPFIGNYNSCNRNNYMSTPYQGYQCCYDDADTSPSGFEFLKKNPTTTFYSLRNVQ